MSPWVLCLGWHSQSEDMWVTWQRDFTRRVGVGGGHLLGGFWQTGSPKGRFSCTGPLAQICQGIYTPPTTLGVTNAYLIASSRRIFLTYSIAYLLKSWQNCLHYIAVWQCSTHKHILENSTSIFTACRRYHVQRGRCSDNQLHSVKRPSLSLEWRLEVANAWPENVWVIYRGFPPLWLELLAEVWCCVFTVRPLVLWAAGTAKISQESLLRSSATREWARGIYSNTVRTLGFDTAEWEHPWG